ncbi:hypothetical protein [Lactiplantibacillus plajomi]
MFSYLKKHKVIRRLFYVFLVIGVCLIGVFVKTNMELSRAKAAMGIMLKENNYVQRIPRSKIMKSESGPFSGIVWYEYTFSNAQTLAESKKYLKKIKRSDSNLTLKNCPIVYRVILRPPTKSFKRWTGQIYLDTNRKDSAYGRSYDIQLLNDRSSRVLN